MRMVGYARESVQCSIEVQVVELTKAGAVKVFKDADGVGGKQQLPGWQACLKYLRDGDTLVIAKLDRIAGTATQAIRIIKQLDQRSINIRSLSEPAVDTTRGRSLFDVVKVLAELNADTLAAHTKRGMAAARLKGRALGRPTVMTPEKIVEGKKLRSDGMSYRDIGYKLGVSRDAVRKALARYEAENAARIATMGTTHKQTKKS